MPRLLRFYMMCSHMKQSLNKFIHPDLLNGRIFTTLIAFALPIFISYLFQQLYNATDTVIVGNFLNENSLAAIGASSSIYELVIGFGSGFGSGMGLVAARAFGSGDMNRLKKCVASSIIITFFITLILTVAFSFAIKPLLVLLKTPEEVLAEAFSYIILICIFCGVMFAYNLASGLLRAIGNSFMPLVFLVFSSVLNIILDILFITKFGLGIRGAAIATVIAQAVSAVLCIFYIFSKAKVLIPSMKAGHFKSDSRIYRDLIGQGASMALMGSLVTSGTVVLQSAINGFGSMIIAGHLTARKLFSLSTLPIFTSGIASATFVSQNYGAKQLDRVRKGVRLAILITTIWSVLLVALAPVILRPLISFISGSSKQELLDYGYKYLTFAYPFYIVLGVLIVLRNALQGLGSKLLPLGSSIIELIGKILFTVLIIPHLGIQGIIMCEPLIWCAMMLHLLWAYVRKIRSLKESSKNPQNIV